MMAANGLGGVAWEDGELVRHRMGRRIIEERKGATGVEWKVTRWHRVCSGSRVEGV